MTRFGTGKRTTKEDEDVYPRNAETSRSQREKANYKRRKLYVHVSAANIIY